MLTRRVLLKWTGGALAAVAVQGRSPAAHAQLQVPLAVVVGRHSRIEGLTRFELKRLYLGANLQAPGGERLLAFHQMQDAPERVAFERGVLGMDAEQLARYWIDRKIRGEGGAPRAVASAELLQRVVSQLGQSVGYVRIDQVGPGLRAIPIDGLKPGDPRYPGA